MMARMITANLFTPERNLRRSLAVIGRLLTFSRQCRLYLHLYFYRATFFFRH
nr:MAG TPA: hypothetical protein [Caudoviricetes sp.]